jgi:hypothetical protein
MKVFFLQEVQPIIYCTQGMDEYVSKRVKARFAILNKLVPMKFGKRFKISVSHFLIVFQELPNLNQQYHHRTNACITIVWFIYINHFFYRLNVRPVRVKDVGDQVNMNRKQTTGTSP